jgi:hypothetical protein
VRESICTGSGYRELRVHPRNCADLIDELYAYKLNPDTGLPKERQPQDRCDATRYVLELISGRSRRCGRRLRRGQEPGRSMLGRRHPLGKFGRSRDALNRRQ